MEPQPGLSVHPSPKPSPIVVMGVCGAGKTTVAAALAQRLGVPFMEADTLHPQANVTKMAAGKPLDDDDRRPWLRRVGRWLADHPGGGVISCSALARRYRDTLRENCPQVAFLHLSGSAELIGRRLAARSDHFMPATLLRSQLDTLEPLGDDERGVTVDIDGVGGDVDSIVEAFLASG